MCLSIYFLLIVKYGVTEDNLAKYAEPLMHTTALAFGFGQLDSTKLVLAQCFGTPDGAKLTLDRPSGRPAGAHKVSRTPKAS